jgi:hypothetical protein
LLGAGTVHHIRSGREQMQQKYLRATNRVCNAA